jgi:hypothetical protein
VQDQTEVVTDLMNIAEIEFDPAKYENKIQERKSQQVAPEPTV